DALAGIDGAALLLELPKRGAQAVAGQVGTRAGHQTWVTQDGITVSFRNGALSTTRGLGNDLMAADLDEVVSALKGHREQALRLHQYLDGEDQTVTRAFICDYTTHGTQTLQTLFHGTRARHITETCVSTDLQFENQYWFGPRGILRKSRQWVGPENGPLLVERIKD
ncbi:MAG: YjbF family lipoprotein, partial [Paracoccaceae bacterium]